MLDPHTQAAPRHRAAQQQYGEIVVERSTGQGWRKAASGASYGVGGDRAGGVYEGYSGGSGGGDDGDGDSV